MRRGYFILYIHFKLLISLNSTCYFLFIDKRNLNYVNFISVITKYIVNVILVIQNQKEIS